MKKIYFNLYRSDTGLYFTGGFFSDEETAQRIGKTIKGVPGTYIFTFPVKVEDDK